MKQRIISGIVCAILLIAVLFSNEIIFDIALMLIVCASVYELTSAIGLKKMGSAYTISCIFSALMIFLPRVMNISYLTIVSFYMIALLLVMLFRRERYTFNDVCVYFTSSLLLIASFIHFSFIRHMEYGLVNVLVAFIGCWITDTCAYFSGVFFGKHKLVPQISPKKTIEGSVGGVIGLCIILSAYVLIVSNIMNINANLINTIIIGLICGIVSQFGDLCASIIKREHNIKDFGNLIPGHGGVMDRFDSAIFVAPIVYYFITNFPIFI